MKTAHVVARIHVQKKMLPFATAEVKEQDICCESQRFGMSASELRRLLGWLAERQVYEIAMESTAQYWRSVWMARKTASVCTEPKRGQELERARKSDFADAARIVRRPLSGDLTLSYVPDAEERRWRMLTRGRRQLIRERVGLRNR